MQTQRPVATSRVDGGPGSQVSNACSWVLSGTHVEGLKVGRQTFMRYNMDHPAGLPSGPGVSLNQVSTAVKQSSLHGDNKEI